QILRLGDNKLLQLEPVAKALNLLRASPLQARQRPQPQRLHSQVSITIIPWFKAIVGMICGELPISPFPPTSLSSRHLASESHLTRNYPQTPQLLQPKCPSLSPSHFPRPRCPPALWNRSPGSAMYASASACRCAASRAACAATACASTSPPAPRHPPGAYGMQPVCKAANSGAMSLTVVAISAGRCVGQRVQGHLPSPHPSLTLPSRLFTSTIKPHPHILCPPPPSLRCKSAKCGCRGFFYIVAEGSWVLRCRCKHKHVEHDAASRACAKAGCRCGAFDSPWVCNCDHPWGQHSQRVVTKQVVSVRDMMGGLSLGGEVMELGGGGPAREVNDYDALKRGDFGLQQQV
ncbi:hypothetical protein Agub_g944, partial [Astrephomene gubernaculifera]